MAKGKNKSGKKSKEPKKMSAPMVAVMVEDRAEEMRNELLSKLETIEGRLTEMNQAWDSIVQGLESRTKERYEMASKKLAIVRNTLKEQALVDLRNLGKVLAQLNRKALKGMPSGGVARMKDIMDIENVFKQTTNTLDRIVDDRVHGNIRELQNRLDSIFKARLKAMDVLDKKAKASLETALRATKDLKELIPKSSEEHLIQLGKAAAKLYKHAIQFSVKKVRAKKKDLAKIEKNIRDLNKVVMEVLKKWPVGARPPAPKKTAKPSKA
jgi:hypothetical protein